VAASRWQATIGIAALRAVSSLGHHAECDENAACNAWSCPQIPLQMWGHVHLCMHACFWRKALMLYRPHAAIAGRASQPWDAPAKSGSAVVSS
jgi:hypothetical protein